jgi:hypothetical protein
MNKYVVPQDIWEILSSIKPIEWNKWELIKLSTRPTGSILALFKEPKLFRPVFVEIISEYDATGERVTSYEVHR